MSQCESKDMWKIPALSAPNASSISDSSNLYAKLSFNKGAKVVYMFVCENSFLLSEKVKSTSHMERVS